jgi:RNA polymerase sigma factor (sigma-70 family)
MGDRDVTALGQFMATDPVIGFLKRIGQTEKSDAQLLNAFVCRQDDRAFEGIMRRHAPMVWGVCRRMLSNLQDAEDAFQATFVVLGHKASSIRSPELLANWLYQVAHTTARKARQKSVRRSSSQKQTLPMPEPEAASDSREFGPDDLAILDEELDRLPEKYRIVIMLCDLEGKTRSEVAQQLRLPQGTVASRLARGRGMLAKSLFRRGVAASAMSVSAMLTGLVSGSAPPTLLADTVKALGVGNVATIGAFSAKVSVLANAALKTMTLAKLSAGTFALLLAVVVLCGSRFAQDALASRISEAERPVCEVIEQNVEFNVKKNATDSDDSQTDARRDAVKLQLDGILSDQRIRDAIVTIKTVRSSGAKEVSGNGVIVDERGLIITNKQVVSAARNVYVFLNDGTEIVGDVLMAEAQYDLAVVRIKAGKTLHALRLAPTSDLRVGEHVIAIGHPEGDVNTASRGIVSAVGREFTLPSGHVLTGAIQTDASIDPGYAGGPLFRSNGELIGINVAERGEGNAFAINTSMIDSVLANRFSVFKVSGSHHGLKTQEKILARSGDRHRLVLASSTGELKAGDMILTVGSREVTNRFELERAFWGKKVGEVVEVNVKRADRETTASLTLVAAEPTEASAASEANEAREWFRKHWLSGLPKD